jgi:hypothetical protein
MPNQYVFCALRGKLFLLWLLNFLLYKCHLVLPYKHHLVLYVYTYTAEPTTMHFCSTN